MTACLLGLHLALHEGGHEGEDVVRSTATHAPVARFARSQGAGCSRSYVWPPRRGLSVTACLLGLHLALHEGGHEGEDVVRSTATHAPVTRFARSQGAGCSRSCVWPPGRGLSVTACLLGLHLALHEG
ncbi:hypothetical protein ENSA7_64110 [Enhygromyxa salina]|uniref:Uncharacterized protein n=1 Tax=Enhygromyxa salina TaxID=215803 RepID=A0A2S9Y1M6_9BACT|nr:hypothetical protein ENSA7_64110 [Enhygromyxa salina]